MMKKNLDYIIYNAARQIPIALAALCALLTVGCSETLDALSPTQTTDTEVTFSVAEQPWDGQSVELMRSGETLSELQDSTYAGFGLYSDFLSMTNLQVKWDVKKGKWVYGDKMLWPKNKVDTTLTNIYAYAPYTKSINWNNDKSITIESDEKNPTDWLWALPKVDSLGIIHLDFRHALAQLSFGSITNTYGSTIRLMSVSVSGDFYTKGNLSLADSTWTVNLEEDIANREYSKEYETIIETKEGNTTTKTVEKGIEIENGDAVLFDFKDVIMQIPGANVTITFKIKTKSGEELTITRDNVELLQGKNQEINLKIGQNHEVVIK